MSTSQGGANLVRYFFYAGTTIKESRKQALIALAYATAREQYIAPKAILIRFVSAFADSPLLKLIRIIARADIHDTTTILGRHQKDPQGWHGTFAYKDASNVIRELHESAHGYTTGKDDFTLKEATATLAKKDSTPRGGPKSGKIVWPVEADLVEYHDGPIAYSHLPENK